MRAERRVAEAALDAARAQLDRTQAERRKLDEQLQALGDGSEQASTLQAMEAKAEAAAAALAAAETHRVEAEGARFGSGGTRSR